MIIKLIRLLDYYLVIFGIDISKAIRSLSDLPAYIADYRKIKKQRPVGDSFKFGRLCLCLGDRFADSGQANGQYFHQDLLVASRIFANKPKQHIDVGSRIDGFVAHVASYRQLIVVDIRPLSSQIRNIVFLQVDLMRELPAQLVASCDSLSCLHALEHFGLGRYGDPVRWDGYRIGLDNLLTMLKPGGKFYLSIPIGRQRIEFNAHRVFAVAFLLEMFLGRLRIDDFSYVDDRGDFYESIVLDAATVETNCGCSCGCGIFELTKL